MTHMLTRPYVTAGLPDWADEPADPDQAAEEAAGDPAAPAGDEDQGADPCQVSTPCPQQTGRHAGDDTAVTPPTYAGVHRGLPPVLNLAWCSGEVGHKVKASTRPRHRARRRPSLLARLIGQVRQLVA